MNNTTPFIEKFIPLLQFWWGPISVIGILIGVLYVVSGTMKLATKTRQGGHEAVRSAAFSWFSGILLVNIITSIDAFSNSFFGVGPSSGLSYVPPNVDTQSGLYVQFFLYVVMIVGLAGFIRGFSLLKASGEDPKQTASAVTHIIGSIFAINIVTFITAIGQTFGGDIGLSIAALVG